MPAEVIRDPLSLKVSLPGQEPTLVKMGEVANPLLAADLAEGLAATVHPNGPIAKLTTLKAFVVTLRRMVRELAADGFTGSAAELSRPCSVSSGCGRNTWWNTAPGRFCGPSTSGITLFRSR
ncbi:hypothetical protein NKH18_01150 [Streptomyces sp. M10(2022)]